MSTKDKLLGDSHHTSDANVHMQMQVNAPHMQVHMNQPHMNQPHMNMQIHTSTQVPGSHASVQVNGAPHVATAQVSPQVNVQVNYPQSYQHEATVSPYPNGPAPAYSADVNIYTNNVQPPHTPIQPQAPHHQAPVFPAPGSDLPPGWLRLYDAVQRPYFINTETRVTQWAHPITGVVYDPYAPAYECPTYYSYVAETQQKNVEETFVNPDYSRYTDGSKPAPTDTCHPQYYAHGINVACDPNVISQAQLDTLSPQYIDSGKFSAPLTLRQKCCGTMGRFKGLTILTFLIWASAIGAAVAVAVAGVDPQVFIPAGIFYSIYFCCYVFTAGFFPLFWLCCGRTGINSEERIVESLRAKSSGDSSAVLHTIDSITTAYPLMRLNVECYHYETRTRQVTKTRTRNGKSETYTDTETYTEKVVTYEGYRKVPIVRFRDISASSAVVADIIQECPSNMMTVGFRYLYDTHQTQRDLISILKKQFYYCHSYRDDHCSVTSSYSISSAQPSCNVVVKQKDCGYWTRQLFFFNPISFFLWAYSALYLIPAIVFRSSSRLIQYDNVKYIHIGCPNPLEDVCTYSRPRWTWRWNWY